MTMISESMSILHNVKDTQYDPFEIIQLDKMSKNIINSNNPIETSFGHKSAIVFTRSRVCAGVNKTRINVLSKVNGIYELLVICNTTCFDQELIRLVKNNSDKIIIIESELFRRNMKCPVSNENIRYCDWKLNNLCKNIHNLEDFC
jgi:hypothetical protein